METHIFSKWNITMEVMHGCYLIPIFIINLKRSQERLRRICTSIHQANEILQHKGYLLQPYAYNAVDYKDPERVKTLLANYNIFTHGKHILPAEVCCTLSHVECIKESQFRDVKQNIQRPYIICEDDIDIVRFARFFERFKTNIQQTPEQCGVLQLVASTYPQHHIYGVHQTVVPWNLFYYSACMYLVFPKSRNILQKQYMRNNKWVIDDSRLGVADFMIYHLSNTYTTPFPYCSLQADESTIHNSHLDFHKSIHQHIEEFVASQSNSS